MIDLQTIVTALMAFLFSGGAEAAKELITGMVVNGTERASQAWRDLMLAEPEVYPLADRVARAPEDAAAVAQLRALLERMLQAHPALAAQGALAVTTGEISADHGSVAAAVINSPVTIHNR